VIESLDGVTPWERYELDDAQVMELLWAVAVARSMARAGAALGAPFRA